MNDPLLVGIGLIALGIVWSLLVTWIDYKLYKNKDRRHLVEESRELVTNRDIYLAYLQQNMTESFLFIVGFASAYMLMIWGWL